MNLEAGIAISYNFVDESSMPNYMRTFNSAMTAVDGDGFTSTREKRQATARKATAHLKAWLEGTEDEREAAESTYLKHALGPEEISSAVSAGRLMAAGLIWISAFSTGVAPFLTSRDADADADARTDAASSHGEGEVDATWDVFFRRNRMETSAKFNGGAGSAVWGPAVARDVAHKLIDWMSSDEFLNGDLSDV